MANGQQLVIYDVSKGAAMAAMGIDCIGEEGQGEGGWKRIGHGWH